MTIPFYEEVEKKNISVELATLTEENKKIGATSTILKITPAFITPNGKLYYTTSEHFSANFYEEIETSFNIIGKKKNLSLKQINEKETLQKLRNDLVDKKEEIINGKLTAGDVRNFINMNCLLPFHYHPSLENLYSNDCKDIILMLLDSKIVVYDYFLYLLNHCNNSLEVLKNYPSSLVMNKKKIDIDLIKEYKEYDNFIVNSIVEAAKEINDNELSWHTQEEFMEDFAVQTIGFDKIESQWSKTITTTKMNKYEAYFNYIIMGYNIKQIPQVKFNENKKSFEILTTNDFGLITHEDEKYKKEAELILKKVPLKDRRNYFL